MNRSTTLAAAAVTTITLLVLYLAGGVSLGEGDSPPGRELVGETSAPEPVHDLARRIDTAEQGASDTRREDVGVNTTGVDESEAWLRVVPDIELHGLSTRSALEYYWGEELPEMIEYLGIYDDRYLEQGFPEGRRLGDIGEYLERAKVHLLSKLSAPLASCDTLAPGLQVPPRPLNLLLLDSQIGFYEFMVEDNPGTDGELLESAQETYAALRSQYFNLRLELQARMVDLVSRDLRNLSVSSPPLLGSIFISPATSKVSPDYVEQHARLPVSRRRWSLSESFWAQGMNTYYSGMYAIQLDLDSVLSEFIADFEAQEARILMDLQNLESSF